MRFGAKVKLFGPVGDLFGPKSGSKRALARSWIAWDAALRFRPAVTPMHFLVTSRERRAVVRCWWLYALHRVVAERRGRRSKIWFLDLVLKARAMCCRPLKGAACEAGYRFKYRSLLAAVVEKSGPLIPGGRVNLKPSPQQKTQMQEPLNQ